MSTDLERVLRDGMERFTTAVEMPTGLARKAYQHRQKRRRAILMLAAAGTATVIGGTVAVVAGVVTGAGPRPGVRLQTTAYVVSRVERALAAAERGRLVEYAHTRYPVGTNLLPEPGDQALSREHSRWDVRSTADWGYRRSHRTTGFTITGRRVFDEGITTVRRSQSSVAVLYYNKTWWRAVAAKGWAGQVSANGCRLAFLTGAGGSMDWPGYIRDQLRCGNYKITGRQQVDGIDAIRMASNSFAIVTKGPPPGGASFVPPVFIMTVWVNPSTYLPVRVQLALRSARHVPKQLGRHAGGYPFGSFQTDFSWFPATRANLTHLHVRIPAGFTRVKAP